MSIIRRGQAAAEREMTLTLTPHEPNGTTTVNGYEVPGFTAKTLTIGKLQSPSSQGLDAATDQVQIGEVVRPVLHAGLHIPIGSLVPKAGRQRGIGWEYVVTTVGQHDDPSLLGRRFLVVEVPTKSKATARRLDVVEVTP